MKRLKIMTLAVVLFLAACADNKPPSTGLVAAPAALMIPCAQLPDIPLNDGDPKARLAYYSKTRLMYGSCADRHAGLRRYAAAVSK